VNKRLARPFEIKAVGEDGTFSGYGSVFGNVDAYGDVIEAGAFKASLGAWADKGKLPAMLWQHDSRKPIGVWTSMVEDAKGLYVEGELALKARDGADAYELLKIKAVSGLSIGFNIPRGGAEWDPKTETYRIKQVDLWEVSPVTFPANESAQVEAVKAALEGGPAEVEEILRDAGFSRSQAKKLMAGGWKALGLRDADGEEAEQIKQLIQALDAQKKSLTLSGS